MANEDEFMRITNKDIYDKLERMHEVQEQILTQAKITNGRVTRLEQVGIGMWIRNNPIKFAAGCIIFISLFISDFRHPIISFLTGLL